MARELRKPTPEQVFPRVVVPKEVWRRFEDEDALTALVNAIQRDWLRAATTPKRGMTADQMLFEAGRVQGLQDAIQSIITEVERKEAVPKE